MTMQDTMLGYARDTMLARVASNGYRSDEYVAGQTKKVTSLHS